METIKKYLTGIVDDENQINDFIKTNEQEIKDFFVNLWEKQLETGTETETVETETGTEVETETVVGTAVVEEEAATVAAEEAETAVAAAEEAETEKAETAVAGTAATEETEMAFEIKNKHITFKNGKVNQYYEIDFDVRFKNSPNCRSIF